MPNCIKIFTKRQSPFSAYCLATVTEIGALLLEDGSYLLNEDGSKIILEQTVVQQLNNSGSNNVLILEGGGNLLTEDGSKIVI
jgi:hypothetical protein